MWWRGVAAAVIRQSHHPSCRWLWDYMSCMDVESGQTHTHPHPLIRRRRPPTQPNRSCPSGRPPPSSSSSRTRGATSLVRVACPLLSGSRVCVVVVGGGGDSIRFEFNPHRVPTKPYTQKPTTGGYIPVPFQNATGYYGTGSVLSIKRVAPLPIDTPVWLPYAHHRTHLIRRVVLPLINNQPNTRPRPRAQHPM